MRVYLQKFNYFIVSLVFALTGLLTITQEVFAASATLSLSPASATVSQGSIVSLGIYVNTAGNPVNAVQANLNYPANLLDYVSTSSSAAFSIVAETTGGNGTVQIARATSTAVTGNQLVGTVKFKAKVASGSAKIGFASGSNVASKGTSVMGTTTGATVTLKAASVAPKTSATATPAAPADTTPPAITNTKVSDIKTNSATISWTTSEPATTEVDYGLDSNYGLTAVEPTPVTEHSIVLDSALLRPGTTYHYVVKSTDPANNTASGKDSSFTAAGLTVKVKVINDKSKAVSGATVEFQKSSAKTNAQGEATLSGLPSGKITLVVSSGGKQTPVSAEIKQNADGSVNPVTLKISSASSSQVKLLVALAAILLAIIGLAMLMRNRGNKSGGPSVTTPLPVIPETDPDLKSAGPKEELDSDAKPEPVLPIKDNKQVVIKPDISEEE